MFDFDVTVVGAGPAGSSAALNAVRGGLRTVIVERYALPRHKPCSGLLVPEAVALVESHFGSPPPEIFASPGTFKAMRMHFSSRRHLDIPVDGWMVWRNRFDQWLTHTSNAEILAQTSAESFREDDEGVTLTCRDANGELLSIRSRVLIAADGGRSGLARQLDPVGQASLPWCISLHDNYECDVDLEPGYFHFFARLDLPMYPASYLKDGNLIVDISGQLGDKLNPLHAQFRDFLKREWGFVQKRRVRRMGCPIVHTLSGHRFQFGTDRVLVAGEASGLMNYFGEGISPALSSGLSAGAASVEAIAGDRPAGEVYKRHVEPQRKLTKRQYNTLTQMFGSLGGIDWKVGMRRLPWTARLTIMKDLTRWAMAQRRDARRLMAAETNRLRLEHFAGAIAAAARE